MSPNRRILLNIIATYGRSLCARVCGVFVSRWVVAALGRGLDDVVGGMTMVVAVACGGFVAVMRRTSQKWYNMQYINMSGRLPMGIAGNVPRVRYSAAYPTGAERIARTPLPWGLTPLYFKKNLNGSCNRF